jgi:hypothetical protein
MTDTDLVSKCHEAMVSKAAAITRTDYEHDLVSAWTVYLEELGAVRMGKLLSLLTEIRPGNVRIPDPISNDGFVEVSREFAERMAVLGLP